MGQLLSEPVKTKLSTEGKDERLMYAVSSMQGWRPTMEDAHTHILDYEKTGTAFFAVYDGHGGSNVAKYSSEKLQHIVMDSESFKNGDIKKSLKDGFLQIDDNLREGPEHKDETSGCTAIVALLTKDNILYSNAGDSRAIICTNGLAEALSKDHKPSDPNEKSRIEEAGGYVEFGRVNGNLALSRALGDLPFKMNSSLGPEKQAVTADPEFEVHKITDKDEFMVLACDGIWDCMENEDVVTFIRNRIAKKMPLKEICEQIMDNCLSETSEGVGCDNMTVEIVAFLNGKTEEEWYEKIARAVGPVDSDRPNSSPPVVTATAASVKEVKSPDSSITATTKCSEDEPELKKHRGMNSESREYSIEELKGAPDLTSSLISSSAEAAEAAEAAETAETVETTVPEEEKDKKMD